MPIISSEQNQVWIMPPVHLLVFISSDQFDTSDRRGTLLENRKLGVETVVTSSSEGKRFE